MEARGVQGMTNNPLSDIKQYSNAMTISQTLKFCEKKGLGITRGMIQNYIRDGLLPSPANKRFYTHKHMAALVLIDRLKTVFDIPTIHAALTPLMDEEGLPMEVYNKLIKDSLAILERFKQEGNYNRLTLMAFLSFAKADVLN